MSHYWYLALWSGEKIRVKPETVAKVRQRLSQQTPIITRDRVIAIKDIKSFDESKEWYNDIDTTSPESEAARAFDEPIIKPNGHVKVTAVKRLITRHDWDKIYGKQPSYKLLYLGEKEVWIAYWLPPNQIDYNQVEECTPEEIDKLV